MRRMTPVLAAFSMMLPICAASQTLDLGFDELPEPQQLERVIDPKEFLPPAGREFVQLGSFRDTGSAGKGKQVAIAGGLSPLIVRAQNGQYLLLAPTSKSIPAGNILSWANAHGFRDAFTHVFPVRVR